MRRASCETVRCRALPAARRPHLDHELSNAAGATQDDNPLIFLCRGDANLGQVKLCACQNAKRRGLSIISTARDASPNTAYHKPHANGGRLLHRHIVRRLQKDPLVHEERLLERSELILAHRGDAEDSRAGFEPRTARADFDDNAGAIAPEDGGPFLDKKPGLLLHVFPLDVSRRHSASRAELAHMGLMPTVRVLTSACPGPGVGRGMSLTTVKGAFSSATVIPD